MRLNYRIQKGCPNCKFSISNYDDFFFCNKDELYGVGFTDMENAELRWEWEDSHLVSWCGICDEHEPRVK